MNANMQFFDILQPNASTPAPVLVWIHGGGYTSGSGSHKIYKPYSLLGVSPDIIVVTINYRLGAFGFLTTGKIIESIGRERDV